MKELTQYGLYKYYWGGKVKLHFISHPARFLQPINALLIFIILPLLYKNQPVLILDHLTL